MYYTGKFIGECDKITIMKGFYLPYFFLNEDIYIKKKLEVKILMHEREADSKRKKN